VKWAAALENIPGIAAEIVQSLEEFDALTPSFCAISTASHFVKLSMAAFDAE
jgi:hypothetical protein